MPRIRPLLAVIWVGLFFLTAPSAAHALDTRCSSVTLAVSPVKPVYLPGETVTVTINQVPAGFVTNLYYLRTTQDFTNGNLWTAIPLTATAGGTLTASWTLPTAIPQPTPPGSAADPYGRSDYQEFYLAVNLLENGRFLCTGNPEPGPSFAHLACPNCGRPVIMAPTVSTDYALTDFYRIVPGYSLTYTGKRFDQPQDDSGQQVPGDFTARFEYEAPIRLCGIRMVPQRHTKSNRWGYWGPANPDPAQRVNGWSDGLTLDRFFINDPADPASRWSPGYLGSPYFKLYRVDSLIQDTSANLMAQGTFWRTFATTNPSADHYYYPPYLLNVAHTSSTTPSIFTRLDTIEGAYYTEDPAVICTPHPKTTTHHWYFTTRPLLDDDLRNTFTGLATTPNQPVLVTSYYESFGVGMYFREDWYLLKNVGVVGVAGAFFPAGSASSWDYFRASWLKPGSATPPHYQMSASRAYLGEPLDITLSPTSVAPGGTYTLTAISRNSRLPYDGILEYEHADGSVRTWIGFDNRPLWVENGTASVTLPSTFPEGIITTRFRAKVTTTPSTQEEQLGYTPMPWSNQVTQTITRNPPSPTPVPGDADADTDRDYTDLAAYSRAFNTFNQTLNLAGDTIINIFDLNAFLSRFGR